MAQSPHPESGKPEFIPYDTSTLSFAESGSSPTSQRIIRLIEWMTGKVKLLRIANKFEKSGRAVKTTIWEEVVGLMDLDVVCPQEYLNRIPATGPVVMVANHPFGFVDGLVLTSLVSKKRQDLKILTRAFFANVPEIKDNMVAVAFPHDIDAQKRNIAVRKEVMDHLANDGIVILFPAGRVATARKIFGPVIEHDWNPFTAKMILKSRARVVPVFFHGQNGFAYQFLQLFSATLRQSLLMHEIWRKLGARIEPVVGAPIERDVIDGWSGTQTEFMAYLRDVTLRLGK